MGQNLPSIDMSVQQAPYTKEKTTGRQVGMQVGWKGPYERTHYLRISYTFKKLGQPRPLFHSFPSSQARIIAIFTTNKCEKCHVHLVYGARSRTLDLWNMSLLPYPLDQGSRLESHILTNELKFFGTVQSNGVTPSLRIGQFLGSRIFLPNNVNPTCR